MKRLRLGCPKRRRLGCPNCGRTDTEVDAVDNFGRPYRGYSCCRIKTLAEIEAMTQPIALHPPPGTREYLEGYRDGTRDERDPPINGIAKGEGDMSEFLVTEKQLEAALAVARAEERERCAKACEKVGADAGMLSEASVAWVCAETIRQLSGEEQN